MIHGGFSFCCFLRGVSLLCGYLGLIMESRIGFSWRPFGWMRVRSYLESFRFGVGGSLVRILRVVFFGFLALIERGICCDD